MTEAFYLLALLAHELFGKPLNEHSGVHQVKVDEHWEFSLNASNEERSAGSGEIPLPPFSASLKFNGWPAGIVAPSGGVIAAGECANEETFIAALRAALQARGVEIDDEGGA